MNPLAGVLLVLLALALLVGALKAAQLPAELSRKGVHIGMGLICVSFPWLFRDPWAVDLLAVLAVVSLGAVRLVPGLRTRFGGVMGGVSRVSFGELWFPIAVALVFHLAAGNWLLYVVPVLTLTLADAAAALIGLRYGKWRYRTDEGFKSIEGSVALFTVAFLSAHVPLLLGTAVGRLETLLIALTIGILVMLLEAIAWRGLDNLIIPLGVCLLLKVYLTLPASALLTRLAVIVGLVVLAVWLRKRTALSDSAVLAAALAAYGMWALGGGLYFAGVMLLYAIYLALPGFDSLPRPVQPFTVVCRVMAGPFICLFLERLTGAAPWATLAQFCLAAHCGNIVQARLRLVRRRWGDERIILTACGVAMLAWLALFGVLQPPPRYFMHASVLVLAIVGSNLAFRRCWPMHERSARPAQAFFAETMIAPLASCLGFMAGWLGS